MSAHNTVATYRDVPGHPGLSVAIKITGGAAGTWTLQYRGGAWGIDEHDPVKPTTTATMADEVAWRLFFNALSLP